MAYKRDRIDVSSFINIDDLYRYIELHLDNIIKTTYCMTDLIVDYRDFTQLNTEKALAQRELECHLYLGNGISDSPFEFYNDNETKDGTLEFTYLNDRIEQTSSPLLLAKYNHLIWKSKSNKNRQYATKAIDNYFIAIGHLFELYSSDEDEEIFSYIDKQYSHLVDLCNSINYKTSELKVLTNTLLFKSNKIKFYMKVNILETMMAYGKIFKSDSFQNSLNIFESELDGIKSIKDFFPMLNYYLPVALKISQKMQIDIKKWFNIIGENYLKWADQETEEERFWLKQDLYKRAIEAFTDAGNIDMKSKTEQLYLKLRDYIFLDSNTTTISSEENKEYFDTIDEYSSLILQSEPDTIYSFIAQGYLFPKKAIILEKMKNPANDFQQHFKAIRFDKNKNIVNSTQQDDKEYLFYHSYLQFLGIKTIPILANIFRKGVESGHLTYNNFLLFIEKKTWMGVQHHKNDLDGSTREINCINLLKPSIIDFFTQVKYLTEGNHDSCFILCMDSLTLKLEGLLRQFCERVNGGVIKLSPKKGIQEGLMSDILENEAIKKYFDEEDILFLNSLLDPKALNLRNDIAHAFLKETDYNYESMILVICALLRIGKFHHLHKE